MRRQYPLSVVGNVRLFSRWRVTRAAIRGDVASKPVCRADYTTQNVRASVPWGQLLAEQSRTAPLRRNNSLMVMEAREVMHDICISNNNLLHYCTRSRTSSKQNTNTYKTKSKKQRKQKHKAIYSTVLTNKYHIDDFYSLLPTVEEKRMHRTRLSFP